MVSRLTTALCALLLAALAAPARASLDSATNTYYKSVSPQGEQSITAYDYATGAQRWRLDADSINQGASRFADVGATPRGVLVNFNGFEGDFARIGFVELAAADGVVLRLGQLFPSEAIPDGLAQIDSILRGTPTGKVF